MPFNKRENGKQNKKKPNKNDISIRIIIQDYYCYYCLGPRNVYEASWPYFFSTITLVSDPIWSPILDNADPKPVNAVPIASHEATNISLPSFKPTYIP